MKGVLFGEKHSYDDWGLTLKKRPEISPPSPKTVYVDVPGSDGVIDLTDSLTGYTNYNNRTMKCTFNVTAARNRWSNIYSEIMGYLQGKKLKVILDEDPSHYYIGRFQVNNWESNKATSTIIIEGNVEPYKMERFSSLEPDEWDSINFEIGVIRDYRNISVNGTKTVAIDGTTKPIVPSFTVTGSDLTVTFKGATYELPVGTTKLTGIIIREGVNDLIFDGNGEVSIDYRGGIF